LRERGKRKDKYESPSKECLLLLEGGIFGRGKIQKINHGNLQEEKKSF